MLLSSTSMLFCGVALQHIDVADLILIGSSAGKYESSIQKMVWSGLVWSGLVWPGLVWPGLAWSGLVRSGVWSDLV